MLTQTDTVKRSPADMMRILDTADAQFEQLPLLAEGESKIIREASPGLAIVRLKPTLYSITFNRTGVVEGTDILRLRSSEILWDVLTRGGIQTTILAVGERSYLTEYIDTPPIEVIVKACQVGTPKHIYHKISERKSRFDDYLVAGMPHDAYVRFDWRNPLPMRDECMPLWLANRFIDVKRAEETALKSFRLLTEFLRRREIEILDICLMIDESGDAIYGEVSSDCMRVKSLGQDLDKDLWRKGKDAETILKQWTHFLDLIQS
jgi:phosphoribosylaminoimidazole-succinocarboxamide synthase